MATLPTPEDAGRAILSIFKRFRVRPNNMLLFNSLYGDFINIKPMAASDFEPGIQWLEQQGFIDRKGKPKRPYFLTEAGFAAI
jgi:hypothetical protein